MKKTIAIIGGGVAGLSAGIYGQMAGFDTTIYEKNTVMGGSLSGWYRDGYAIDNCLHWLTGTNPATPLYRIWEETGVFNEKTKFVRRPYFFASETDGVTVTLWRDPKRTRKEMLEISPEDSMEINLFMDCVEVANDLIMNGLTREQLQKMANDDEIVLSNFDFARRSVLYIGLNNIKWAEKFKSPAIRNLILDFSAKEYESYWLIVAYGFFVAGNADLIEGGSIQMADSLIQRYRELGGTIATNMAAKQIILRKRKIPQIEGVGKIKTRHGDCIVFENGKVCTPDYIICCCDLNFTYKNLLKKSKNKIWSYVTRHTKEYPIYSAFQAAFAVDGLFEEVKDSLSFPCNPIEIARQTYDRVSVKNYRIYGDYIAPPGKTVIQVMFIQYEKDYKYWKKLYKQDVERYKQAKRNVSEVIIGEIVSRFPQYEGKIKFLDAWTPYTYARRNNDTKGAFMRYITTAISPRAQISQKVSGVDNVFLASHWLKYPGGVPNAAYTGKLAVKMIHDLENKTTFADFINRNITRKVAGIIDSVKKTEEKENDEAAINSNRNDDSKEE